MTAKEAMEIRNNPTFADVDNKELHQCIDNALEKQIPKKPEYEPIKSGFITANYKCPNCDCRRLGHANNVSFCPDCGQAFDWNE